MGVPQDLAAVFDRNITIAPASGGSFVAYAGEERCAYGFTNLTDLMTWLQRAAQAQQAAESVEQLTEAQVAAKPWPAFPTTGDTRRTTALGSLADRLAAAEQPKGAA